MSKTIMLFLKSDLKKRKMTNISNNNVEGQVRQFEINIPYVRDAILYYTIHRLSEASHNTNFIHHLFLFKFV